MKSSKQCYVRFHVRVDEALTRASEATGLKRATLTAWILQTYLRGLNEKIERGELSLTPDAAAEMLTIPPERLGISPAATVYALKIGRTAGHAPRSIGKPILLTLPPEAQSQLKLFADLCGLTLNHFRGAVVASFLIEQKVLQ